MAKQNAITFEALAVNNPCYQANRPMPDSLPSGIVVHSTGCNNPNLSRYVNAPDICGENKYNNYYDRPDWEACPHAVIGKDKDGVVRAAKLLPYNICCWNCASGRKGSYNFSPAYLQFEICEDALDDEAYFMEAFTLAAKLCHRLMKNYDIPIENIISHKEAHARGYASNHADCDHWLSKFGKDMDWFRELVLNNGEEPPKQYRVSAEKVVNANQLSQVEGPLKAMGFSIKTEEV